MDHINSETTTPAVDAVIIGAGPAGSTAAALLAEQGLSVCLVERDEFPRFRIGESLLPGGNALLKRLGVWDKMDAAGFIRKYGADAAGQPALLRGWLLDASGRTAFLGRRLGHGEDHIPYPKRFAVYNHFEGVPRREGREGGNIIITRLQDGWFWAIPLDERKTSVGVVSTRKREQWKDPAFTAETFFRHEVERSPYLSSLMRDALPCDSYRVTADYTYSFTDYAGPRYLLMGDAAGFIDPIFSSGVYLAMRSGSMAVDQVLLAHQQQRTITAAEQQQYTGSLKKNVRVMRDLIEVYYDSNSYSVFMSPSNRFQLFQSVNSIVAGNSNPGFALKWRFRLFLWICRLNRVLPLVPQQKFS